MSIRSKILALVALFVLTCATMATAQAATLPAAPRDPIPPPVASPSGLDGAGFINAVAVDPFDATRILVGGDVSGVHWSDDRGATYHGGNKGLYNSNLLHIADVEFSPTVPGKAYAGAGIKGNNGGFLVSTDKGRSWVVRSTKPQFASDNAQGTGLPSPHPRSTGNLIAADPNGVLYAATYNDGLMRSTDDGQNWQVLGLAGKFLRGLALDPANPDVLYVAAYTDGVYVTTTARGAGTLTKMSGAPDTPEELTVVDGVLWLAGGPKGVWKATGTAASRTWSQIPTAQIPLATADRKVAYQSITGYKPASGAAVLYAGNVFGTEVATQNGQFNTVYRSDDGGTTWQSVTDIRNNISFNVNQTGPPWWLLTENTSFALGRGTGIASQIAIDPHDPNRLYVAGRSGVWASNNRGDNWFPVVGGLGATIPRGTAAEANSTGNMYVAIADWVMVQSSDFGKNFEENRPPGPANVGYGVDVDDGTVPNTVYVAVGERDNPNIDGEVFHNANPTGGGAWVSDGLGAKTGGKRVLNVVTKRIGGRLVILAAVEAGGVWRKEGVNGTWTKATGNALSTSPGRNGPQFAGHTGTGVVYLYDQSKGIFRSNDEGRSFTLIWDEPVSGQFGGYIAVDPLDPGRVYVSQGKTAYRLDGADNGTVTSGIQVTDLKVSNPGPPGVASDGSVWIAQQATENKSSALLRSLNDGALWTQLVDPEWEANGGEITDTILGGTTSNLDTARIYAGFDGTGVLVFGWGQTGNEIPADLAPSTSITKPANNEVYKQTSVQITGNATDDHAVSFVNVAIQDKTTLKWLQTNGTWGADLARLPATVNSPGATQTSWSFATTLQPGSYTVHAAAIDNSAFEDANTVFKSFSVTDTGPGWNFETLDGAGGGNTLNADVGSDSTVLLFGGQPHVFYRADGPGNLRHAWWTGTGWGYETLDGAGGGNGRIDGNVGADPTAVLYNGMPHVWYHDVGSDNLRHGWWDGTKWVFETLDGAGGSNGRISGAAGAHPSAIMYNGAPHVWYEGGAENLRHGWWDGKAWVFETLDGAGGGNGRIDGTAGVWNSAMLYNGAPHVWYQGGAQNLRHGWWDGHAWFFETLDGAGGNNGRVDAAVGQSTTAILYQNNPHVWYGDSTNGDLRHAWWDGVKWNAETNDGAGAAPSVTNAGTANTAMLFNGQPHVWYRETVGGDLRHAWYDAGWHTETLDGISGTRGRIQADVGEGPAVLMYNGGPQVWYGDITNGNLRHAWYP